MDGDFGAKGCEGGVGGGGRGKGGEGEGGGGARYGEYGLGLWGGLTRSGGLGGSGGGLGGLGGDGSGGGGGAKETRSPYSWVAGNTKPFVAAGTYLRAHLSEGEGTCEHACGG